MHSQFDFDKELDTEALSDDRNVLNEAESINRNIIFHSRKSVSGNDDIFPINDPGNRTVEFTEDSTEFFEAYEDLDLLNGNTRPVVRNSRGEVVESTSEYQHRFYNPENDISSSFSEVPLDSLNRKSEEKFSKESFGLPDFFKNPIDLIIICIILLAVIILEVIGLIAVL